MAPADHPKATPRQFHDPLIAGMAFVATVLRATMMLGRRAGSGRVPLPPSLQAAASRKAIPRRPPKPGTKLREAARSGLLTKSNTRAGTRGRQALDAEHYAADQAAGARKGLAPGRARSRHREPPPAGTMSTIFAGVGFVLVDNPTPSERRRLARYDARVAELDADLIRPERFQRLVESWKPFRGERFESDPAVVLAILENRRLAGEPLFVYEGRRP